MTQRTWITLIAFGLTATMIRADDDKAGPDDNKPPEGFVALFNGKDLTGWQGLVEINKRAKDPAEYAKQVEAANAKVLPNWTVKDGILYYDGKSQSLQTVKDYGDFELMMDWKLEKNGDSGIYIRGQPQIQIWDPASPTAKNVGSGGLFNNQKNPNKALKVADKPVGEWNHFHITVKGDKVTVILNGEKVVDETVLENYFERGQPLPEVGPIELQHHGDRLWFKNMYIKELSK